MSTAVLLGIGVIGGLASVARLLVDGMVARRAATPFPVGTLAVNLSGAFLLGVVAGAALSGDAYRLLATGALGAFTTFSTWALEAHRLAESGQRRVAALNLVLPLLTGLVAAWLGRELGASW